MSDRVRRVAAMLLLQAAIFGCQPPSQDASVSRTPADKRAASGEYDLWFSIELDGRRLGFEHAQRTLTKDGEWAARNRQQITLQRDGDAALQSLTTKSWEDESGCLLRFEAEYDSSGERTTARGKVADDQLQVETQTGGRPTNQSVAWPADGQGLSAPIRWLRRTKPQPGDSGAFVTFAPFLNRVTDVVWTAVASDASEPSVEAAPVRVELVTRLRGVPGVELSQTIWLDAQGSPIRMADRATGLEWRRVTRDQAVADVDPSGVNWNVWAAAPLEGDMPPEPRNRSWIRYRVHMDSGSPLARFRSSARQKTTPVDEHTIEIVARRQGTREALVAEGVVPQPPAPGDSAESPYIQTSDPEVRRLANLDNGGAGEAALLVALERRVAEHIATKSYSKAFQSAAEAAKSREGDCTEHALLLAALCRVRNTPTRVVTGLVYHNQAFAYHMWNEAWVDGGWRPLDATVGRGGVTATHLELAASSASGADAFSELLPVMSVLGSIRIEVVDWSED